MYLKYLTMLAAFGSLGACATLPSSGPTGSQIEDSARDVVASGAGFGITIIEVDNLAAVPLASAPIPWSFPEWTPPPTDMIGPGDVLSISIFEAGVALFGGDSRAISAANAGFDPSVRVQTLPLSRVDDNGDITVPYAGRLRVLGKTVMEIQEQIRNSLRNLSQDPQVLVSREQVISNSVIVGGEVTRPGRLVLQTNQESMADVIALSGGYRGDAKDLVLRVERGQNEASARLSDILTGRDGGLRAYPGDRLTLISEPMTFSVLGASGRAQQAPFSSGEMSVIEAISTAGGPDANLGDPSAVFVFRFDGPQRTDPVVFHFNMMNTQTYFLAQQFALRDGDILYFANAEANQPGKLIQLVSQLFAPIVTATNVANSLGN